MSELPPTTIEMHALGHFVRVMARRDPAVLDEWVDATGPLLHAGCSLPMGTVLDEQGCVPGIAGLRVIDASALPVLPTAAPNATVSVLAAHLAATWPAPG